MKPTILLITLDQLHREAISALGAQAFETPNIDRIADEGMNYTRAYTASPLCLPSRCSIATGLYPHSNKCFSNIVGRPLPLDMPNIFKSLKKSGYETAVFGKCHFSPVPYGEKCKEKTLNYDHFKNYYESLGIEHLDLQDDKQVSVWFYDDYAKELEAAGYLEAYRENVWEPSNHGVFSWPASPEWHPDSWTGNKACKYIEECESDSPQFLWLSFSGPHYPIDPPRQYLDRVDMSKDIPRYFKSDEWNDMSKIQYGSFHGIYPTIDGAGRATDKACKNFDDNYWERWRHSYYANIVQIDDCIGEFINKAKSRWGDNLMIIFTCDHGEMMGNHSLWGKQYAGYEDVNRIPLFIKMPQNAHQGICEDLVQTIDILPTCLSVAGVEEIDCDGHNLFDDYPPRDYILSEADDFITITSKKYRFTHSCIAGEVYNELFDLENDPHEYNNVYEDKSYESTKLEMLNTLAENNNNYKLKEVLFD